MAKGATIIPDASHAFNEIVNMADERQQMVLIDYIDGIIIALTIPF